MSTHTDPYGTVFQTNSGSTPTAHTPIVIINSDGSRSQGTWMGCAVKN